VIRARRSIKRAPPDDPEKYLDAFRQLAIFSGAPSDTLSRLAAATDTILVPAGAEVVSEGRIPTHFFVVATGLLDVLSTGEGLHDPAKVNALQEGDHFGEIGLLEGMPATATVRAATDCVLYRVAAADFLASVASSSTLSDALVERVTRGLAKTHPSYAAATAARATAPDLLLGDLARVADAVGPALRAPGEDELLKAITATAMNIFGAAACSLALLRDDGSLEFRAASGAGSNDVVGLVVPPGAGIAGAVLTSGEPLVVADVASDERFHALVAAATGYRPRSIVARPLETARGPVGVIEVLDASMFDDERERALTVLALFARLAAVAIENGRAVAGFGRTLLTALSDAASGTPLAAALDAATRTGGAAGDVAVAPLVQRLLQMDPAARYAAVEALTARLDGAARGDP
jgi:CRP-like cAMP-binding protein